MRPNSAFQSRSGLSIASLVIVLAAFLIGKWVALAGEPKLQTNAVATNVLEQPQTGLPKTNLLIGDHHRFRVEMALTEEQTSIGLMFRKSLPEGNGMVFTFQPPRPVKFWMKNTKIPLDMLFLSQGRVVHIQANAQPCVKDPCPTYGPDATIVDMVVELPAGTAQQAAISTGTSAKLEWPIATNAAHSKTVSQNKK